LVLTNKYEDNFGLLIKIVIIYLTFSPFQIPPIWGKAKNDLHGFAPPPLFFPPFLKTEPNTIN
jgi:hypothetical protein